MGPVTGTTSKWIIERSADGEFYAGTNDRKPVWTKQRRFACVFPTVEASVTRARGIAGGENYHPEYTVKPV